MTTAAAMAGISIARSELVLGGQKSGKTARAESLAAAWLARSADHRALYLATARDGGDDEMRRRIARHRSERAARVPALATLEEPLDLGPALARASRPDTLVVVDCLTLWLTNWLLPAQGAAALPPIPALLQALREAAGPVVLVSNEIGLGVIPLGREVREFVDALGCLNQQVAQSCARVTLMVAGIPLVVKEVP